MGTQKVLCPLGIEIPHKGSIHGAQEQNRMNEWGSSIWATQFEWQMPATGDMLAGDTLTAEWMRTH